MAILLCGNHRREQRPGYAPLTPPPGMSMVESSSFFVECALMPDEILRAWAVKSVSDSDVEAAHTRVAQLTQTMADTRERTNR